jgi:hypothetical protein
MSSQREPCFPYWIAKCITILFLGAGCATSDPVSPKNDRDSITRTATKGEVELTIQVSPKNPRLSDFVEMEVQVTFPNHIRIEPPVFGQSVGDFAVREYGERKSKSESKSGSRENDQSVKELRTFRYQLEPMFSGRHLIRSIPIVFAKSDSPDDSRDIIQSEPIEVEVQSDLGDAAPDLANVDPMLDPMGTSTIRTTTWAIGLLIGILVLALVLFLRSRKKKPIEQPSLPPEMIASLELDRLIQEDLPRQGRVKEFYLRLTGIVREYIEGTTGLHAPEQTTEEFLREVRHSERFDGKHAVRLQDFLEAADMVKYAAKQPNEDNISQSVTRAKEFISTRFVRAVASEESHVTPGDRP